MRSTCGAVAILPFLAAAAALCSPTGRLGAPLAVDNTLTAAAYSRAGIAMPAGALDVRRDGRNGLRGVFVGAGTRAAAGDTLLIVPLARCLRDSDASLSSGAWADGVLPPDDPWRPVVRLAIATAHTLARVRASVAGGGERALAETAADDDDNDDESFERRWLQQLPSAAELRALLPVHWNAAERAASPLHGPVLELACANVARQRAALVARIVGAARTAGAGPCADAANVHEALDLVQTRSCSLAADRGGAIAIVPVVDMTNHGGEGGEANSEWKVEGQVEGDDRGGAVVLRATRALVEGDEVRYAYDDGEEWERTTAPERWLVSYGFIPADLPQRRP